MRQTAVTCIRHVIGSPPDRAAVECVAGRSRIQALDRRRPILQIMLKAPERHTQDYRGHGTTIRLVALSGTIDKAIGEVRPRQRANECRAFLRTNAEATPTRLEVRLTTDNHGTHKTPSVKTRMAHHLRIHAHFTRTYSVCLNRLERRFATPSERWIHRETRCSTVELAQAADDYLGANNGNSNFFCGPTPSIRDPEHQAMLHEHS